jgi:site-specific DNA recombinase
MSAHPVEGPAVANACKMLLGGGTISGVMREWQAAGQRPAQSKSGKWSRTSIRTILLNPRIAGLSAYRGEIVGTGQWEPLVAEVTGMPSHTGRNIYRCAPGSRNVDYSGGHVARQAAPVEDFITRLVIARLSRPDAVDLLATPGGGADVAALREEGAAIRATQEEIARDRCSAWSLARR